MRALLRPRPLEEIRTEQEFEQVDEVAAADGVKIAAPELGDAMAGAPIRVIRDRDRSEVIAEVEEELAEIEVTTRKKGSSSRPTRSGRWRPSPVRSKRKKSR